MALTRTVIELVVAGVIDCAESMNDDDGTFDDGDGDRDEKRETDTVAECDEPTGRINVDDDEGVAVPVELVVGDEVVDAVTLELADGVERALGLRDGEAPLESVAVGVRVVE